jgi:glycosyltransferase involved in cell wall biosynthesis
MGSMPKSEKPTIFIEALALTTPHVSGIGHTLASLVQALTTQTDAPAAYTIVLFTPKGMSKYLKKWRFKHVIYKELPLPKRAVTGFNFLGVLPAIDRWLGRGVYVFGNYANYPLTSASTSLTYIYDVTFERHPELVSPKVRMVLHRYVPKWAARTKRITTISAFAKKEITDLFPIRPDKITVIPCGVDLEVFYRRSDEEVEALKAKYHLPSDYLLYVGNIEPRKNLERLVEAYAGLPPELREAHPLVLVGGDGWLNQPIHHAIDRARARGCNIVQPTQYVADEDLPALYSGARLLAHPALYEGFGISPLQAMACGTPVLTADASSLPEVVGEAALLVDPSSVTAIQGGLIKLLKDNYVREQLITKGYQQSKKFPWSSSAQKLLQLIRTHPEIKF